MEPCCFATVSSPNNLSGFHQVIYKDLSMLLLTTGIYTPSVDLLAWRDKNHKWLELMEVHSQETSGVKVTVMPFYMGRKELHSGSMGEGTKDIHVALT